MKLGVKSPKLSTIDAEQILQDVFLECYQDANSIPVDQLEQYSNYRTERLSLQKIIAIIGGGLFVLLPLLFVSPNYLVAEANIGERNLPVYTIQVKGILPIYSVTAVQGNYSLPVYQRTPRQFSVEPTANGKMTVTVTLFSKQFYSKEVLVSAIDEKPPRLITTSKEGDSLYIYLQDDDSGVNFESAYLVDGEGNWIMPASYDEEEGYLEIKDVPKNAVLYVDDKHGNRLTIEIK